LSRPLPKSTGVEVQLGTVAEEDKQPVFGRVLRTTKTQLKAFGERTIWVPTPAGRFVVRTVIDDKVIPSQLVPGSGDVRTLGAKVEYRWSLTKR
jgi:hypothetical protein